MARGVYRSVEVKNDEPGWSDHPVIVVANHPTGFSDPALLLGDPVMQIHGELLAPRTWTDESDGWGTQPPRAVAGP